MNFDCSIGGGPYPDPASRFQPQGLHGPSQVIDPGRFPWTDGDWKNVDLDRLVLYELHVGAFTAGGAFASAVERLAYLKDLGVTAVQLMPVAAFPGERNWGYDGAALFAPASCYGAPDDLRTFVNEAHRIGLAVHLDVVYNHFGPDGAYGPAFNHMLRPESEGGWGLDGVWSDDFHHQMRRHLAGDADGYFSDFDGAPESIAATVRQGWFFTGQYAPYFGRRRGTDPSPISPAQCVFYIQNHDQVGNRAFGDRLHHTIDAAAYRAATVLLLLAPESPLLFMGQEWAAGTPFQFFTDHEPGLGQKVTEGRRREFARFRAFADPALRAAWEVFRAADRRSFAIRPCGDSTLVLRRGMGGGPALLAAIRLAGAGACDLGELPETDLGPGRLWRSILTTEEADFALDPVPMKIAAARLAVEFSRPGAVIFAAGEEAG